MEYQEVKDIINKDSHLKIVLKRNLDLIVVVDSNFEHIQQLETLLTLFKSGFGDYYVKYLPEQEALAKWCAIVAENTRANHYRRENKFDDVYTILNDLYPENNLDHYQFKQKYYKLKT